MTEPTSRNDALAAASAAQVRLAQVRARRPRVVTLRRTLDEILEENHFSVRIARAFGLEDDRK